MKWKHRQAAKLLSREGLSKVETAKRCGVVEKVIYDWIRLPGFKELMEEEEKKKESILDAHQDNIDEELCSSAEIHGKDGTGDRRLFYQKQGQLIEKKLVEFEPLTIIRADKTGESKQGKEEEDAKDC